MMKVAFCECGKALALLCSEDHLNKIVENKFKELERNNQFVTLLERKAVAALPFCECPDGVCSVADVITKPKEP